MTPNDQTTSTTLAPDAPSETTIPPAPGAALAGTTPTAPADAVNTALSAAEQAIHDARAAEIARVQSQPQASSPSASGILAFAVVGMPVQFMPRAFKGNDPPKLCAAAIVSVGENGAVDLRVFPPTHAPTYMEVGVPPYAGAKQPDGGFYWQLIGGLEG